MAIDHTMIKALIDQNQKLMALLETTISRALPDLAAFTPATPFIPAEDEPADYTDWTDEFLPPNPDEAELDLGLMIGEDGPIEDEILGDLG